MLNKIWLFLRPVIFIGLFQLTSWFKLYWAMPLVIFCLFVSVVCATHDITHNSLRFKKPVNDVLLFLLGALLLESGHSYQLSHRFHHSNFPHNEDPEGEPAKKTLFQVLLSGPLYLPRLFIWALKKNKSNRDSSRWLIAEGLFFFLAVATAIGLYPVSDGFLWYVILVIIGGWLYPLLTVYIPHHKFRTAKNPLGHTVLFRGKLFSVLFINLIFHLEHHLFPQIPTCNLGRLSQRLTPFLTEHKDLLTVRTFI